MKKYGNKNNNLNSNTSKIDFDIAVFDDDNIDDKKKINLMNPLSSSSPSHSSYSSSPLPLRSLNPNSLSLSNDNNFQNDEWLSSDFNKNLIDDNSLQAKRKKQPCEEGAKKSKARIEQFSENIPSAFSKTTNRKTKEDSLRELIQEGDATDIKLLTEKINQFKNGKTIQAFEFVLQIPNNLSVKNSERFKNWLELIGFEETSYGHDIAYTCKTESLIELDKILKSITQHDNRNNKKQDIFSYQPKRSTKPITSTTAASEGLLRIETTSFRSIDDLPSLLSSQQNQQQQLFHQNHLSINTDIPFRPRIFQDRDSPTTEPPTPYSDANDDLSPRSLLVRSDSSLSRSMSNPSPLESGFLNMVQEKFLIETQFQFSSSINTILEGTEIQSDNNTKEPTQNQQQQDTEEVVDINEISHVSSIGANHTEDSDMNTSKDAEQDLSGHTFAGMNQSDVVLPLKSSSSKDSLLRSINICKPLFNKLSGGRESSLSLFSPVTTNNFDPNDNDNNNSNNTSMEVDQFPNDSNGLLNGLRRISHNDLKNADDQNKMEDDSMSMSFHNNFPKIKKNNGWGNILKRSSSESEISSKVSLSQYSEATLTPGQTLGSLSHSEIDKLESGKKVHYQTPQNTMFLPSKYELSEGADCKIIQFLMNKVNILDPPNSGDKNAVIDTMKRSVTTPIQCIERGSINTYFSKSSSCSNFNYKSINSDEKIRFNNMIEKNARSSIVDYNNIPSITATSLTHHRSKSSDTLGNFDNENVCQNARMSYNMLSQTKMKSSIADTIITKISTEDSSSVVPTTIIGQSDEMRNKNKIVKSKSKYRRMSVNMQSLNDSSVDVEKQFSPTAKAKASATRRQSLVAAVRNMKNNSQDDLNRTTMTQCTVENSSNIFDSHSQSFLDGLNEINFKGVVIGGTYQHCFENSCPVVAAPTSNDKRVVDAKIMSNNSLLLRLFVPKDNACKEIDLSTNWKWMRSSPIGVLVYKQSFRKNKPFICYYLHKHPNDWNSNKLSSSNSQMQLDVSHIDHSVDTYETEMDLQQPNLDDQKEVLDISNQMDVDEVDEETFKSLADESGLSAEVAVWTNSGLIRLVLEFLLDSPHSNNGLVVANKTKSRLRNKPKPIVTTTNYSSVCKAWALSSYMITAQRLSRFERDDSFDWDKWSIFAGKYHWKFLSEGACKKVFLVQVGKHSNAISVMDINDLLDRGMEHSITQELEISILCSSLVTLNICPNLIVVYSLFQANYPAPKSVWYSPSETKAITAKKNTKPPLAVPKKSIMDELKGRYQFIRMEFCSGGDVEELVRKRGQVSISLVRNFLFQMCYSLYCSRDKLALRHYDIKLLNFFATSGSSLLGNNDNNEENIDINLQIAFGSKVFNLRLEAEDNSLIKLADFGTSVVGATGLGEPINIMQFTTLENTPPEFFYLGSHARQSYSSDTFCLGLSFLHLLTGYEPYEELLKDVHCPKYLYNKLRNLWYFSDSDSQYYLIKQVIDSLDCEDLKTQGDVLYDTLYRYMVLFGATASAIVLDSNSLFLGCEVWTILSDSLCLKMSEEEINNALAKGLRSKDKTACLSQFRKDFNKWSIHHGNSSIMNSVRDRLNKLGGDSLSLLESMLHFDPSQRCSMTDALNHSMFDELINNNNHNNTPNLPFLHYFRQSDELAMDLPIL